MIQKLQINRFLLIFLLLFVFVPLRSETYRVFFKDKGPGEFSSGSLMYESAKNSLSQRCLVRRAKVMNPDSLINFGDVPVYLPYLDSLKKLKCNIRLKLKWKNYAMLDCDSAITENLRQLPFVIKVQKTGRKLSELAHQSQFSLLEKISVELDNSDRINNTKDYNYGESFFQAELMNIPLIHRFGIGGNDVLLGFIDSGFRWRFLSSLANADVKGEYDFVYSDTVASNQSGDNYNQDHHGTLCFGTVAGFIKDKLIGIAPNASFLLAKTEDIKSEKRIEEDNYAAAIEWMEAAGADITSSSLGYSKYDTSETAASFDDFDGNSTIAAQAINIAVAKGMVCVTSAGNSGSNPKTIVSPADADSAITIGATNSDGTAVAGFSSRGPNAKGKLKPELSALGTAVFTIVPTADSLFLRANGTSLSTPLVSGGIALMLSAFPELKNYEIKNLLLKNASQAESPDNNLGYGIPNFYESMLDYGIIIGQPGYFTLKSKFIRLFVFIDSRNSFASHNLYVRFNGAATFTSFPLKPQGYRFRYFADIPIELFGGKAAEGYILADDGFRSRRMPFDAEKTFIIKPDSIFIPFGVPATIAGEIAENAANLFVYPSILTHRNVETNITLIIPEASDVIFSLYNPIGQKAGERLINTADAGVIKFSWQTENLPSGPYFLHAEGKGINEICTFIISR